MNYEMYSCGRGECYHHLRTVQKNIAEGTISSAARPLGVSLRHIRSQSMGRLVTIREIVVRTSDVKPAYVVATYMHDACGCEVYQVV